MLEARIVEYYTYEDYAQWEGDWELIEGIPLAMTPSPVISHQALAMQIAFAFNERVESCEECLVLAEQDWKIDEETVVKPDVVLTCHETGERYLSKAPKIVVEVVSPSSARRDEVIKFELYAREGVLYYLLAYPGDRKVRLYRLGNGEYRKEGDFREESYRFEWDECSFQIDFKKIFSRLRR
jgi:Uma2 family endonuclease